MRRCIFDPCAAHAGKAELGLPVSYHQHQFILHHRILHEGVDSDMIVPFV
ncbi:MAG: hypothetical protein OXM02_13690 [Bacteroidota bacterium]|nr:hypothetical protein [Bacteroidota bacterium]MDE2835549.1 hypothetical protein [Bacteroidota bacterium]MDE2957461.1 hypothetical protein [Bacteroidota bacterium]